MQREFINIASHEMKTPTQAILGTSGLLKYYPERKDELIGIIQRNAKRLQTLISNILDVTRIESQTLILNKEQFDIRDLVSSVIEDYKDRTKDSIIKLSIKNNNNNNPIYVEADGDRIVQVLSNLLSNSIKFTNQGEISINLFEKIQEEGDGKKEVLVSVTDTGSGINSEIFGRLFSNLPPNSFIRFSNKNGTAFVNPTADSSLFVNPVIFLPFNIEFPSLSVACNSPAGP
ncbi:MAG: sensor histidine kinase [Nitrososphaeraceae archaeon]